MDIQDFLQWLPIFYQAWQWFLTSQRESARKREELNKEIETLMKRRRRILAIMQARRFRRRNNARRWWIQPALRNRTRYWEENVPLLDDVQFQRTFRLSRISFNRIVEDLRPFLSKENTHMRESIPVDKRVAVALYMLKSNCDLATVRDVFGIGKSTVGDILHEVCSVVSDYLYQQYVKFPYTPEDRKRIAEHFLARWQFPGVIGALDGSHIPILAPNYCHEDYINYKNYHSVVLMGLVDSSYNFIYTNIGKPGRANDASIFADSELKRYFDDGTLLDENLHIIGDGAFPLLGWLLVPYIQSFAMPAIQKHFNYRLSRARIVVENAFGRLKGRWRILLKRADMSLPHMTAIIQTCVVLHNICEENNDKYYSEWDNYVQNVNNIYPQPNQACRQNNVTNFAKLKRDHLAENLARDGVIFQDE